MRSFTRSTRVSRSAVKNRPMNRTPHARAASAIAHRCSWRANTASTTAECPAATGRRTSPNEGGVDVVGDFRRVGVDRQGRGFGDAEDRLALGVGAQNDRAREAARYAGRACARGSTCRCPTGRRPRRSAAAAARSLARQRKYLRAAVGDRRAVAVRGDRPRGSHLGADGGAHRQKQRHRGKPVEVLESPVSAR